MFIIYSLDFEINIFVFVFNSFFFFLGKIEDELFIVVFDLVDVLLLDSDEGWCVFELLGFLYLFMVGIMV